MKEPGPIVERIEREAGVENLVEILAERLSPTDLQSLLLEVFRRRAGETSPSRVLERYLANKLVGPSDLDAVESANLVRVAFSLLPPGFEALELSPVAPLGTVNALATLDQNRVLAAIRNTEVVSDSTNVLALECAARRRQLLREQGTARERVDLCASHRLLRPETVETPEFRPHFRLLALCSAGRDEGSHRFELATLLDHLGFYLRLVKTVAAERERDIRLEVSLTELGGPDRGTLEREVLVPLSGAAPEADLGFDPDREEGRAYYQGMCFHVHAVDPNGKRWQLVDGGFTDWTQRLLSDRKERLLISGIGTDMVHRALGA